MNLWNNFTHFAGLDWARDHHDLVLVDSQGQICLTLHFEHNNQGWQKLREKLIPFGSVPVAIETNQGLAVEQLLALGCQVYPVNPKKAQRFRERKAPNGVKNDHLDAWSLADALRMDGSSWKPLQQDDAIIKELRLLCRDEIALIQQRTLLVNQLRQALSEYYPSALSAFEDWTMPATWAFVLSFPTPEALKKAKRRRWISFLHTHKLWRPETAEKRLALFAENQTMNADPAVIRATSLLAVSLAKLLHLLDTQLRTYRQRITALFTQHPDHSLFQSLPGAGEKLAPRLLGEIGADRSRFPNAASLQCYAGTAPISFQSGQIHRVKLRRACAKLLRHSVHLWADRSRLKCAWAKAYYQHHRKKGKSHASALRCLGQRWLKILWKMLKTYTPYSEAIHTQNQTQHGSWILALKTSSRPDPL